MNNQIIAEASIDVNEAPRQAENAQQTADSAKSLAETANKNISNINDPNYLTPFEKPQLEIQMDNFATIYAADKDIATAESINFTTYDAAYHSYLAYMKPLTADISTYSPIVRTTFNSLVVAVQNAQKAFNAATQAKYDQDMDKAKDDIANNQSSYAAMQQDVATMKTNANSVATIASAAISSAGFANDTASTASQAANDAKTIASQAANNVAIAKNDASDAVATANSTASEFGKVSQKTDSAFSNAVSAESAASSAVAKASSAAADSKDAKQIAGAVSQSYKILTDGSTMTIAELENGLATKLTKTDLDGYATQTWAQNKINATADGINATVSSVKNTVDSHTTDINNLKADSRGFKTQFDTVNKTLGKQTTDIGTLQATSKSLSSNFNSLSSDNKTNQHDIGQLQVSAKTFNSTLMTVQQQVTDSSVGINLLLKTGTSFSMTGNNKVNQVGNAYSLANGYNVSSLASALGTQFTISFDWSVSGDSPSGTFIGQWNNVPWGMNLTKVKVSSSNASGHVSHTFSESADSQNVGNYFDFRLDNFVGTITISNVKLEKGSLATDWCPNPADNATVTALMQVKRTADGAHALATNNQGDLAKLQITAKGLQSTVSDKVSSSQLTQLSNQLTNKISDLSSSTSSQFTQTFKDINGLVKKGDVVNQFNLDAGGALLETTGNSTKIVFSSPNIIFDSKNPVQIPNANIPGTLTGKTIEAGTITATTKIKGSDIEAPLIHSPSGSFKLDGKTGDIVGASIHSADNSWGISKDGIINGSTLNGATINTPTLNLGSNGTLTTDFNISQPTGLYAPKKGTGTLTIKTGVINSRSQNMSRYSNTAAYWYGFDDNGNMVKNGTNQTGDDYAPGYEKHDIMKSNGNVLNRSYLDAMALTLNEGGTKTFNTMLTAIGLESGNALLHKDLATNGTFEAALGTGNKYGFRIGSKVIAPMIRANHYTYAADVFISRYGTMGLSTSTKANKLDIVDVPNMLQKGYNLLTLNPRQWFDKTSVEAYADVQAGNTDSVESVVDIKPVSGMVAEEVASAGLDDYVVKDENNKVQGLAYDRLWTLLLPVLRDMNDKINKLQKKEGI